MIHGVLQGFFHSLVFYCMYCTIRWPDGKTVTLELLWTKGNIILIILHLFTFFAQVGMALILLYLLLLCIGTKCTCLICQTYDAHYDAYNLKVHIKAEWKKKFSKSFYFSLIWETIFCMNINTMADILACIKNVKQFEEKKRMYRFCCNCIYLNIYWNMSYY